ncbi:MAG: hypothetical protein KatS3mg027_0310 [Bacteroidia bacterium]|nr:MAG: hypothetical protein KatS3mg027_0310 [Bacteroidia bacterium]
MKYILNIKTFFIVNLLVIYTTLFFLTSCSNQEQQIENINIERIAIENFDDEIFSINENNLIKKDSLFSTKYFPFYQYYLKEIIYFRQEMDSSHRLILDFVNDKDIKYTYLETKKVFTPHVKQWLEEEIVKLHKHIRYYFPEKPLPKRYLFFISGFNFQIVYPENTDIIGIATDMYLGYNHQVYQWLQWPQYRIKQLQKEFIPVDIAKAWLFNNFPPDKYNNLLEHIIYYGKIIYALKHLTPHIHDTLIFSYSLKQWNYCKKYEKNLWAYFLEENKLYDNSPKTLSAYLNDGPFTAAISKECPPRIGMFVGYKIVESFMKKNDVNLQQLFNETNAQKILQLSKYKP